MIRFKSKAFLALAAATVLCLTAANTAFAQAAPPISSFQVYAVRSAQSGGNWEYLNQSDLITKQDHGGSYIEVAIECIGYPSAHGATMATFNMAYQRMEYKLDAQRRVIGFYLIYRISNRIPDGNVSIWGTSINNGRRFTDSIRIR